MKLLRLATLFTMLTATAIASAPENIVDRVYSESTSIVATGLRGSNFSQVLLKADGSYVGLFSSSSDFTRGLIVTEIPQNGVWFYRRIDNGTGELSLDATRKTLVFTDDAAGTVSTPNSLFTTTGFSLNAYEAATPLANCSNRSFVRTGTSAFAGFVITSPSRGRVLVRAVGPGLQAFGVTDPLHHATIKVVRASDNTLVRSNDGWDSSSGGIIAAGQLVGAFPLTEKSKDSAALLSLAPGAYIAEVSSPEVNDSGQVLVEIYLLP